MDLDYPLDPGGDQRLINRSVRACCTFSCVISRYLACTAVCLVGLYGGADGIDIVGGEWERLSLVLFHVVRARYAIALARCERQRDHESNNFNIFVGFGACSQLCKHTQICRLWYFSKSVSVLLQSSTGLAETRMEVV